VASARRRRSRSISRACGSSPRSNTRRTGGRSGRILFVGSVGGILASQFAGAYHASKFAIEAIEDVWRQELDPQGIAVILIEPSAISTRENRFP
jgi:NAD(P)-dependent dehydrogenase (short-subunit alcohol dehydrogenase family)